MSGALRSTWKGAISFGMVHIPVKAYTSTDEKTVKFNQLHRGCGARVKSPKWCPDCQAWLEASDIDKGYEIRKGEYVVMTDDDFDAVPVASVRSLEIVKFIDPSTLDVAQLNKLYYVGPDEAAGKAFDLLRTALAETGLVALAKWTYSSKERLAVIRLYGDALALQTLFWADEVKDAGKLDVPHYDLSEAEVEMAVTLVNAMKAEALDLSQFRDEYRDALLELIAQKDAGEERTFVAPAAVKPATDLMAALKASVEAARAAA